jgi:hypothetical protein
MALASKKSQAIHSKDGAAKEAIKANFDAGDHTALANYPGEAALLYQIQQMQEDINELRRYLTEEVGDGATGSTGAAGARGPAGAAGSTGNSHLSSWNLTNAGRGSLTVTDGSTTWTITGGR